jgi:hypothetical protein
LGWAGDASAAAPLKISSPDLPNRRVVLAVGRDAMGATSLSLPNMRGKYYCRLFQLLRNNFFFVVERAGTILEHRPNRFKDGVRDRARGG